MDLKGIDVNYYFFDDNTDKDSSGLLEGFKKSNKKVIIKKGSQKELYKRDSEMHHWKANLIDKIIGFKNQIITYAKENNFDYLFLVDSDIVMNPITIRHLMKRSVDIISEIFYTAFVDGYGLSPQVVLKYDTNFGKSEVEIEEDTEEDRRFLQQLKTPGIYKCGGLGACTLINKQSLQKGVSFTKIDNLTFFGEDAHFCVRARALDLELYVDTSYPAYHIYRKRELAGLNAYRTNGYNFFKAYSTFNNESKIRKAMKISLHRLKKIGRSLEKISIRVSRVPVRIAKLIKGGKSE